MNAIKTTLLLGLLSGLLIIGGGAIAGDRGLAYGLVMAVAMNFFSYFFSEKVALMSARAQRVSETEHPEIYARLQPIVGTLAQRMGIPMPKLWVTPDLSPNAFATGRNPAHASVAVTSGILQLMKDDELAAVLAHELGHGSHPPSGHHVDIRVARQYEYTMNDEKAVLLNGGKQVYGRKENRQVRTSGLRVPGTQGQQVLWSVLRSVG